MPKKPKQKKKRKAPKSSKPDSNQIAFRVLREATSETKPNIR